MSISHWDSQTSARPSNPPSHGSTPSDVLAAGYCWKGDTNRLPVLATTKHRDVLLEPVLGNLAESHSGLHPDVTYAYLLGEEFVDMHVKDWVRGQSAVLLVMMRRSFSQVHSPPLVLVTSKICMCRSLQVIPRRANACTLQARQRHS